MESSERNIVLPSVRLPKYENCSKIAQVWRAKASEEFNFRLSHFVHVRRSMFCLLASRFRFNQTTVGEDIDGHYEEPK